jgi:hypothetical protein
MGEAKVRSRSRVEILRRCNTCIYCGIAPATTVEHMPPRIMFTSKLRPNGFEFAACNDCNQKTKMADLFVALVGRVFPDSSTNSEDNDIGRILSALGRNLPAALLEMKIGRAGQKLARKQTGIADEGGFLRLSGPIATQLLDIFAHKLGLAMHYEATGKILQRSGGVATRVFSNVEAIQDEIPDEIFRFLPAPTTLRQGSWDVGNQFTYSMRVTEGQQMGLFFASFRFSISIVALTSNDISAFQSDDIEQSIKPHAPASLWK